MKEKIRYSWLVARKFIPPHPNDEETIRLVEINCLLHNLNLWKEPPAAPQEMAWKRLIVPPIIDQMNRTKDPLGFNFFRRLTQEAQQRVLKEFHLLQPRYAFVFVAPDLRVANAYAERLVMTYALTTEKIPLVMPLSQLTDMFRSFYTADDDYECCLKAGLLVITDAAGSIADIDKIDNKLVSFLSERHGRGKTTVFVVIANDEVREWLAEDAFDAAVYKKVQTFLNIHNKAFGMYLSPENSYVYTYCIAKDGAYVCRTLISD